MSHESEESSRIERISIACFSLLLMFAVLAYSFRFHSFRDAKELVLCAGLLPMAVLWAMRGGGIHGFHTLKPFFLLVQLLLALTLMGGYAHDKSSAFDALARWLVLLFPAAFAADLLARPQGREWFETTVIASGVCAAILSLSQYAGFLSGMFPTFGGTSQRMYSVFGNHDALGGYLALVIPVLVARLSPEPKRALVYGSAAFVVVFALALSGCRTAWLAAVCGAAVVMAVQRFSWRRASAGAAIMAAAILAAASLAPEATIERIRSGLHLQDAGAQLRLWFWDGALRMIADHPLLGVGPGNYEYWSPSYLGEALHASGGKAYVHNTLQVLYAHNDYLEVVATTGLLGLAFFCWFLFRLLRSALKRLDGPVHLTSSAWGPLTAWAVFALGYFPLSSPAHAFVGLCFCLCLLKPGTGARAARVHRYVSMATAICCACAVVLAYVILVLCPSYRLQAALNLQRDAGSDHIDNSEAVLDAFRRAAGSLGANGDAYYEYGTALLENRQFEEAKAAFTRAHAGVDTGGIYLALGWLARHDGDTEAARVYLQQCLFRWPSSQTAWRQLFAITPREEREALLEEARTWLPEEALAELSQSASTPQRQREYPGQPP